MSKLFFIPVTRDQMQQGGALFKIYYPVYLLWLRYDFFHENDDMY